MNEPRFVLRTHYQICHPGIFSVLIARCSFAAQSSYLETVAQKLQAEFKGSAIPLNEGAAKFGVQMAQAFGFLSNNLFWTSKGHTIHVIANKPGRSAVEFIQLSEAERLCYLKYYLEADGAVILELGKRILDTGTISKAKLLNQPIIDEVFKAIYQAYSELELRHEVRARLKRLFQGKPYDANTRSHKIMPHLRAMADLGLIKVETKNEKDDEEIFHPTERLRSLLNELKSIIVMERRLLDNESYLICAKTLWKAWKPFHKHEHSEILLNCLLRCYEKVVGTGAQLCAISTLFDVAFCEIMAVNSLLVTPQAVIDILEGIRAKKSPYLQFHVDNFGERAYVKIHPDLLSRRK